MKNAAVLNRLNDLELKVANGGALASTERTFLQLLRDALGAMVRPATGLTIAYSAMVVGNERAPYAQSRTVRAQQAYASLAGPAWRHRWAQRLLLCIALCVTVGAVWESARVALGRSLLQSVQSLHTQQVTLSDEMTKLLEAGRPSGPVDPVVIGKITLAGGPVLRLCDRPRVLAWQMHAQNADDYRMDATHEATLYETPAQQSLCDRDTILAADFRIAHNGLIRFASDWVSMISPSGSLPYPGAAMGRHRLAGAASAAPLGSPAGEQEVADDEMDVDFYGGAVFAGARQLRAADHLRAAGGHGVCDPRFLLEDSGFFAGAARCGVVVDKVGAGDGVGGVRWVVLQLDQSWRGADRGLGWGMRLRCLRRVWRLSPGLAWRGCLGCWTRWCGGFSRGIRIRGRGWDRVRAVAGSLSGRGWMVRLRCTGKRVNDGSANHTGSHIRPLPRGRC